MLTDEGLFYVSQDGITIAFITHALNDKIEISKIKLKLEVKPHGLVVFLV